MMHFRITGRVQGVGFRWSMQRRAVQLGLSGWVRNCLDGSVEAVASGSQDALLQLCAWTQHGPPGARVDEVLTTPWQGSIVEDGFQQWPTI